MSNIVVLIKFFFYDFMRVSEQFNVDEVFEKL